MKFFLLLLLLNHLKLKLQMKILLHKLRAILSPSTDVGDNIAHHPMSSHLGSSQNDVVVLPLAIIFPMLVFDDLHDNVKLLDF
ncbi:hypothetical protein Csa_022518 [Cucumis sativus]|uniref:Uncharacterized protein n=1 Tax=Cucumis sativus TaxID=3659 RepID=A0A0A0LN78_CUCSA|nr:hypothetical protein Csa_022518 [Cucumis sativus]